MVSIRCNPLLTWPCVCLFLINQFRDWSDTIIEVNILESIFKTDVHYILVLAFPSFGMTDIIDRFQDSGVSPPSTSMWLKHFNSRSAQTWPSKSGMPTLFKTKNNFFIIIPLRANIWHKDMNWYSSYSWKAMLPKTEDSYVWKY